MQSSEKGHITCGNLQSFSMTEVQVQKGCVQVCSESLPAVRLRSFELSVPEQWFKQSTDPRFNLQITIRS